MEDLPRQRKLYSSSRLPFDEPQECERVAFLVEV
jgi:hypothetical protein